MTLPITPSAEAPSDGIELPFVTRYIRQTVHPNFAAETESQNRPELTHSQSLRTRISDLKGAEERHFLVNKYRDLSLKMWVEARAGIEPACKDLQSSA